MAEPGIIAVAGDWHGNLRWSTQQAARIGTDHPGVKLILHAGDFGIWPGRPGRIFLEAVTSVLAMYDTRLWFIDGNHEDFDQLEAFRQAAADGQACIARSQEDDDGQSGTALSPMACDSQTRSGPEAPPGSVPVTSRITWLPRGTRWDWRGRTWLAMGGAHSPDRAIRVEKGWGWWPQEDITDEQVAAAAAGGPADVLLSHDVASGVFIAYDPPPPHWHQTDLDLAHQNRRRLQSLCDAVKPYHLIHGHHHRAYQRDTEMGYGLAEVTGLGMDGSPLNWLLLDTESMDWEMPGR